MSPDDTTRPAERTGTAGTTQAGTASTAAPPDGSGHTSEYSGVRATLDRIDDRLTRFQWGAGVVTGAVTFVASYVVFFATVALTAEDFDLSNPRELFDFVGWVFYGSQFVEMRQINQRVMETSSGAVETTRDVLSVNALFAQPDPSLPIFVYVAVPVVVLVVAAVAYSRISLSVTDDLDAETIGKRAINGGLAVTIGYLLVALVGTFVFAHRITEGRAFDELHPDRLQTLAMGVVYPLVIVSIVTAIDQHVRVRRRSPDAADPSTRSGGESD